MPVLYLIACAAPPAADLPEGVRVLREAGWDVWVSATPNTASASATGVEPFLDLAAVEAASGHPVRIGSRAAGAVKPPPADAVAAVPLTVNSLAKWALLINDNAAVGSLHEAVGARVPIVAQVWAKQALRDHPAFDGHVARLAAAGVRFLPHGAGYDPYPWWELRDALANLA